MYSSHVHLYRREWLALLGIETERDGANRWTNGSLLGRTLAERTRRVNGFIFPTEKRGFTGNSHQLG